MTLSSDLQLRRAAKLRVWAKLSFRVHLLVYVLVNGGLTALNLLISPGYLWCLWVLCGWGVGVVAHAFAVYGVATVDQERLIAAELAQMRRGPD